QLPLEDVQQPLASLLQRLLGALVDGTLGWICLFGPVIAAGDWGWLMEKLGSGDASQVEQALGEMNYPATPILLGVLAAINMYLLYRDGQTIGKRMLGTRILRTSGQRAGLIRILVLRVWVPAILYMAPYVGGLILMVGPLPIFLPRRRCLHDYLADTKVVRA
ncbi:MAG: RDD family protein, partial [Planctomycetes bacterium]|nr:RDD family protein [Planctomycetota bacterium]